MTTFEPPYDCTSCGGQIGHHIYRPAESVMARVPGSHGTSFTEAQISMTPVVNAPDHYYVRYTGALRPYTERQGESLMPSHKLYPTREHYFGWDRDSEGEES